MAKYSKSKIIAISIFLIGVILIFLIYAYLQEKDRTAVNAFTLFGTYFSLYGIIVAYIQIQSIKSTSKETKLAVDNSMQRINQILSVSELSKANKIIQEIQSFITQEKYEIVLMRMKDLKTIIIQVKYNKDLSDFTEDGIHNKNLITLGSDINSIHKYILSAKKELNFTKVTHNLEELSTTLTEFENKLKYKQHDT